MTNKRLIPCLYLESGRAVTGFGQRNLFGDGDVEALAGFYSDNGADELLVFDFSSGDEEHEKAIARIREICAVSEIPVMAAGNINRMEDVKKLIYAGCAKVALNFSKQSNIELLEEMSKRFGQEKMYVCISSPEEFTENKDLIEDYAGGILALDAVQNEVEKASSMQVILHTEENHKETLMELMKQKAVGGLSGAFIPVSEDQGMIDAVNLGALTLEKLEAMTCVCSVGLDMIAIPGDTKATTISGLIADEMAIGMVNQKTTAVRIIPVIGKGIGETVEFGGLLGYAPVMPVNTFGCDAFVNRGGRIPAPIHSFKN